MLPYIKKIAVHKVRHLCDLTIELEDKSSPKPGPVHLLLTGRNGSGKTSLLCAIRDAMTAMAGNGLVADTVRGWIAEKEKELGKAASEHEQNRIKDGLKQYGTWLDEIAGSVELFAEDTSEFARILHQREALFAYYDAQHSADFTQPKAPSIPDVGLTGDMQTKRSRAFVEFLVNLKVQSALFRGENKEEEVQRIESWFARFEEVLKRIFNSPDTRLDFEPRDYTFSVVSGGVRSPMANLSDGYAAILDIVSDLILKMQQPHNLIASFDMPGVVLIDEVETHLHLELQRLVLPILTSVFPRIQFIITTHSPFVLSSIGNAVAFDLERQEPMDDADEYPYESLTEGYFGVQDMPAALSDKLSRVRELARQETLSDEQKGELGKLIADLNDMQKDDRLAGELAQISLLCL